MRLILASASPRRRELLTAAGLEFEVVVSPVEEIHDASIPLDRLCEENACLKAAAVASGHPAATVIGADTLVWIAGEPLGKPSDAAEARALLRKLSGRAHTVCTGVCLVRPGGAMERFHVLTEVEFRELDDTAIEDYLTLVHTLDKAGGYAIQEHGERVVAGIRGSYSNVVGLPIDEVIARLFPAGESDCEDAAIGG
ncbi:MAG TPA: Maf family protein [Luteolibacter sp.]